MVHASAAQKPVGFKMAMDRITIMLCCNATGTQRRKLFVIGKSKNPRSFHSNDVCDECYYKRSDKAWMKGDLFNVMRAEPRTCTWGRHS